MSLDEIIQKDKEKPRRSRNNNNRGGSVRKTGYGVMRRNGNYNGPRYNPYSHAAGGSIEDIALGPAESRALKVSANSLVKKVAGAIAHCVRIGGVPPALICTGPTAINQAVKALAIARRYLEDEGDEVVDLIGQPSFEGQTDHCVIRLRRSRPIDMSKDYSGITATPSSDPYKVAGAIAGKIRNGERVGITAVGPMAVFHAVESVAVSNTYLRDDRINIKFAPSFDKVEVSGRGEMNAIHFATLSKRLDG